MSIVRVVAAATWAVGAWVALSVLLIQAPWAPAAPMLQAARVVLMSLSGLALAFCTFAAGTALLGLSGMSVKAEAVSRPYQPRTDA